MSQNNQGQRTPRKSRQQQSGGGGGSGNTGGSGSGGGGGHRRQVSQNQHNQQQYPHYQLTPMNMGQLPTPPTDFDPATIEIPEYNLRTLRRYDATIDSIEAVVTTSYVYMMDESGDWIKPDPPIEGSVFLCHQTPLHIGTDDNGEPATVPRSCLFLFNRKDPFNIVVDLATVREADLTDGLVALQVETPPDAATGAPGDMFVIAFWIRSAPGIDGKVLDPEIILRRWRAVRDAAIAVFGTADYAQTAPTLREAEHQLRLTLSNYGIGPAAMVLPPQPTLKETVDTVLQQAAARNAPR